MQCCPLDEDVVEGSKCFYSSEDADRMALFARSFRKFVCFFMKKNNTKSLITILHKFIPLFHHIVNRIDFQNN